MATGIASCDKDDFEDDVSKTKKEIESYFCKLIDCLKERKGKLLTNWKKY